MIYNANLDRSKIHRKIKSELRKELKKWEDDRSRKKKVVVDDTAEHEVGPVCIFVL
jgi:E3 ubiquitin-protein ligase RAD18